MRHAVAAAIVLASLATACAVAPMPRVYVLDTPRDAPADFGAANAPERIQVDRVLIPDYLDSTDIVMRHAGYELVSSSTGRWGERLSLGLRAALVSDLRAGLPRDVITTAPDPDPSVRHLRLSVAVLDVWPNGRCILTAIWSVANKGETTPILTEETFVNPPRTGAGLGRDPLVVSSVASVVAMLADRIAESLGNTASPAQATGPAAE